MSERDQIVARLLNASDPAIVVAALHVRELSRIAEALTDLAEAVSYRGGFSVALKDMVSELCEGLGSG